MVSAKTLQISHQLSVEIADDLATFTGFYNAYHQLVRSTIFRFEPGNSLEDLVQDVFFRAWDNLRALEDKARVKSWLLRIAVNIAIDYLRRSRPLDLRADLDDISAPQDEEARAANGNLVRYALAQLKMPLRCVLILHVVEGHSLDEVAAILEIPTGTVKSRLHAARKGMKDQLLQLGVTP